MRDKNISPTYIVGWTFLMEKIMNEVNRQKRRNHHIKDATEVNMKHKQDLIRRRVERRERARIQTKSEVLENRQIDYKRHMKWLRE